ncbi:hypothetical protein GOBAR_AA14369 [Gossypium barbadense]|uniref:Uncharacterized protein n=1 Tax=Gossypium barbadense TaxID=3634 RepID=A0A2P5XSI1_GOSBA|nr:hypothetical protein GOBAR_AA14369 [Gossypium barbadense]
MKRKNKSLRNEDYDRGARRRREHKLKTHDKPKLRKNKPDTFPNQLKVGDTVLLDAVDPHIVTTTPNEEIPLMVLSIFPFGTVEVSHPKFGTFKVWEKRTKLGKAMQHGRVPHTPKPHGRILCRHQGARRPRSLPQKDVGDQVLPRYKLQPKFATRSLNFHKFRKRSYFRYYAHNPSPQEAYYLWCMANAYMTDLAYFIAFAIRHQTERHRKGVISISLNVTRLARHFGLLNTAAQSSALTLIRKMSPQGITTMLHMRMIERRLRIDPPQYRFSHAIDEEDLEEIPDNVPPQHEEPSTAPPRERLVHAATLLAHLFD